VLPTLIGIAQTCSETSRAKYFDFEGIRYSVYGLVLVYIKWVNIIGKHLSHTFPIQNGLKQGDALLPLLFNFDLECAIRKVQEN
jgi:hypothetical protein